MITSTQLFAAADTIASAATAAQQTASITGDSSLRDLQRQVATQLTGHARQVLSWARTARYREERGEQVPPAIARRIEAATREFVAMAEG